MENINEKYFGKKVLVVNAQNITLVKYVYRHNKKTFKYNCVLICFTLLIVCNIIGIIRNIIFD